MRLEVDGLGPCYTLAHRKIKVGETGLPEIHYLQIAPYDFNVTRVDATKRTHCEMLEPLPPCAEELCILSGVFERSLDIVAADGTRNVLQHPVHKPRSELRGRGILSLYEGENAHSGECRRDPKEVSRGSLHCLLMEPLRVRFGTS